jgi:hypothetical protein
LGINLNTQNSVTKLINLFPGLKNRGKGVEMNRKKIKEAIETMRGFKSVNGDWAREFGNPTHSLSLYSSGSVV